MTGRDDWPVEVTATTRIEALSAEARTVLAALAIVGRASLSTEDLAALVEVADVGRVIDELERRGLLRREHERRYSLLGRIGADVRKLNETIETADRLVGYIQTLAHGGKLTAARLEQDAEAILGIAAWGAEVRQWNTVLELVKTVQASFALAQRLHEQRVLLELGRAASRELGARTDEIRFLRELEQVADRTGDTAARLEYRTAADALVRLGGGRTTGLTLRAVLRFLAVVAVGATGAVAGLLVGHRTTTTSTTVLTSTVRASGPTLTVSTAITLQGAPVTATVSSVTTELVSTTLTETTTTTTTQTVTTTAPIK